MRYSKKIRGHKLIKRPEIQIPENLKLRLEFQAKDLIETILKPAYITPPSEDSIYIADIYSKWQDHYFYLCAEYCCLSPNTISSPVSSSWESKFARLDYVGDIRFNLSYMTEKGKWEKMFIDLTIDECIEAIKNESFFFPTPPADWQLTFA